MPEIASPIHSQSPAWSADANGCMLSVAVPFFNYDIRLLAGELIDQLAGHPGRAELILGDDGSTDRSLIEDVGERVRRAPASCALLSAPRNLGRALIRNRLAEAARGRFLLFLDADMLPDRRDFIERYLELCRGGEYDVICGGRSYRRCSHIAPEERLYLYQSRATECIDAARRNRAGYRYLFTNNIAVRKDLFMNVRLDERFRGWGWEDTEWAIRLLRCGRVHHIDNTATHLGLIDDEKLLRQFAGAVDNYRLLLECEPEAASRLPVTRVSRRLARLPRASRLLGRICRATAAARWLPLRIRHVGLQLYKAALYAPVFREK